MASLLLLTPARREAERNHAREAEAGARAWRNAWRNVFAQCIALALLGYVAYGMSWGLGGERAQLLAAGSFVLAYVLPLIRLLGFFLRHADQF